MTKTYGIMNFIFFIGFSGLNGLRFFAMRKIQSAKSVKSDDSFPVNNDLIYNLSAKVVISRQVIAIFHCYCDEKSPEPEAKIRII